MIVDIDPETLSEGKKSVEAYGTPVLHLPPHLFSIFIECEKFILIYRKCLVVQADVTKEENVERAVAEAVKEFGRVDYAALEASRQLPTHAHQKQQLRRNSRPHNTNLRKNTLEIFQKGMVVNSTGVFLFTKYEIIQMMKQDSIEV